MNLFSKAERVVEEVTIEETPTEVQLSAEPPSLPRLGDQMTGETSIPPSAMVDAAEKAKPKAAVGTSEGEKKTVVSKSSDKAVVEASRRDGSSLDSKKKREKTEKQDKTKKKKNGDSAGARSLFGGGRRALVVKLERVKLDKSKMSNGRVDLKVLKRLRPDLFVPVVSKIALGDRTHRRESASSSSSHRKEEKRERKSSTEKRERKSSTERRERKSSTEKRERKSSTDKKNAGEKKRKPVVVSSGSDSSDSELEAMRARMKKPLLSLSTKTTQPQKTSSSTAVAPTKKDATAVAPAKKDATAVAPAKKDAGRKVVVSSSDEEDRKIREKSEKKRKDTSDAVSKMEKKSYVDRPPPPVKKPAKEVSSDPETEETKPKKKVSAPASSSDESDRDERAKSIRPTPAPPPAPVANPFHNPFHSTGGMKLPESEDEMTRPAGSSSDDGESGPEMEPPAGGEKTMIIANPLFALRNLIEEKEKTGEASEACDGAEQPNVKELLVEKLYSAFAAAENKVPDEEEDAEKKQRMVHPAMFTAGSAMRAFRDLLRMEIGPAPAFLEPKAAPMPLSEFEDIVMKAIDNLDCPSSGKRFLLDSPPEMVNHMAGDEEWFGKFKELRRCNVVVRDVKKTAGYRSRFARALELHEKDAVARRRRRKERLLNGLKMVKEYSASNSWQRGRKSDDGFSSKFSKLHNKRPFDSDSNSDSDDDSRNKRDAKWKKKDYDDPNKVQSGFK